MSRLGSVQQTPETLCPSLLGAEITSALLCLTFLFKTCFWGSGPCAHTARTLPTEPCPQRTLTFSKQRANSVPDAIKGTGRPATLFSITVIWTSQNLSYVYYLTFQSLSCLFTFMFVHLCAHRLTHVKIQGQIGCLVLSSPYGSREPNSVHQTYQVSLPAAPSHQAHASVKTRCKGPWLTFMFLSLFL